MSQLNSRDRLASLFQEDDPTAPGVFGVGGFGLRDAVLARHILQDACLHWCVGNLTSTFKFIGRVANAVESVVDNVQNIQRSWDVECLSHAD